MLLFDLTAAFDTLDAKLLVEKLKIYGAGTTVTRWLLSYMTGREQLVDFGGQRSELTTVGAGSPQGSVISPLLFLIMVADLEEWVSEGKTLTYADDTTCYAAAASEEEVRRILHKSAGEILSFMSATLLAANPTKTKFMMFSKKRQDPLAVGDAMIEESTEEELLGMTFNKRLTWGAHLDKIEPELRKRIGILRRLSFHLPVGVLVQMIQPIFTSKLLYGLQLLVSDPSSQDSSYSKLQNLHRQAMKAALRMSRGPSGITDEELLERTGQKSLKSHVLSSLGCMAWKTLRNWKTHPMTDGRVEEHMSQRVTRQGMRRDFPPQTTEASIITRMVECWEQWLPDTIKQEENEVAAKRQIRKLSEK